MKQELCNLREVYAKDSLRLEEEIHKHRTSLVAKDQELIKLKKELEEVTEALLYAETGVNEQLAELTEQAKVWAGKAVLEARIKMAREAEDPAFDKAAWTVETWEKTLAGMGGDDDAQDEAVEKKATKAGTSGADKDAQELMMVE